jgi:hypothetical protein
MGIGEFAQPQAGPKIGPEKTLADLPEAKRQELGELGKLAATPKASAAIEELPVADVPDNSEDGVARLEALQRVLTEDEPVPEQDPEEAAIEEAAEPTIEERQDFIRCMLGNKPYRKNFELFGGAIKLTMADLTPREMDMLFSQLAKEQKDDVIQTVDDWNTEFDRYRLVWTTEELTWGDEVSKPHAEAMATASQLLRKQMDDFMLRFKSTVPYRAMLRASRIFQLHLDKLEKGALNSDFWADDGLGSQSEPISEEPSITEPSPD